MGGALRWLGGLCLALLVVTGCRFDPQIANGAIDCTGNRPCPAGLQCVSVTPVSSLCCIEGKCPRIDVETTDARPAVDQPGGDAGDGPTALPNGAACEDDSTCASGYCTDGVCCETTCSRACESCVEPARLGRCVVVKGLPRDRPAFPTCGAQGTCAGRCDGQSADCAYPGSEITCTAASCSNLIALTATVCDGKGACTTRMVVPCAPYGCDGVACAGGCTAEKPCPSSSYCEAGRCHPRKPLGRPCSDPLQCLEGRCVDGVCCDTACDQPCQSCGQPERMGNCSSVAGGDDPDGCEGTRTCDPNGACKGKTGSDCTMSGDCLAADCVAGKCAPSCPMGLARCTGVCVNLQADRKNCGSCGTVCPGPFECVSGKCGCAPGTRSCGTTSTVCIPEDGPFCCPPMVWCEERMACTSRLACRDQLPPIDPI